MSLIMLYTIYRAATGGKTGMTMVFYGFCEVRSGSGSAGTLVMWWPQWGYCLSEIYFSNLV